ncbi:hypothetical protein ACFYT3_33720 [Nocardia amikacinitolerans]|uniref:hypothetical protein n=1 Tax=Nocardia amikacinitolerans TaxID=756689 RepID=UPI0036ACBD9D
MDVQKRVLTAALTAAAISTASGTGFAEPAVSDRPAQVHYTASVDGDTAIVTVDPTARLVLDGGRFEIRAGSDQVLAAVPLQLRVGDVAFPIEAEINGGTARLTPNLDPARAQYVPIAESSAANDSAERQQDALARATSNIARGLGVGAGVGAIGAGVLGCLLGGVTGAVATAPLAMMLGAGPLLGCAIGAATAVPGGALTGVLRLAGPVLVPAFIEYLITTNT